MLKPDLPFFDNPEGSKIPGKLPRVIDAHVHIFPDTVFSAVRAWFDAHAWKIRYRAGSVDLISFLLNHGVSHVVALQYAHKPGIAGFLNDYMVKKCQQFPGQVTGMATVFPGEEGSVQILARAFEKGLKGVKLHAHVQCFDMNAPQMDEIYDLCSQTNKPVIMHVGREPKSEQYLCDPYEICRADKVETVLKKFPKLKICVPHLGFDEIREYRDLVEKYDTLWLDTAMVLADYFPVKNSVGLGTYRMDRLIYGSDFPNIPYAWDRELLRMQDSGLSFRELSMILHKNAIQFYNIQNFQGLGPE